MIGMLAAAVLAATVQTGRIAAAHKVTGEDTWYGFHRTKFDFDGHAAWVVEPSRPVAAGKPWTWTMQWAEAFVDRTGVLDLLKRGYHHVTIDLFDTRMDEKGLAAAAAFQKFLVEELGFAPKANLVGMSWGGFFSTRYAAAYPGNVARIYLDAPLLTFDGFEGPDPARIGVWVNRRPANGAWADDPEMPVNKADRIAAAKIPVLLLYGGSDTVVPPKPNCETFAERFKAAGGSIVVNRRGLFGHHPHGLDPDKTKQIVDFFAAPGDVIPVRAVAHRGLWDEKVAENTVEAIRRAYEAGAECVETDFHEEKDGRMMCYHDLGRVAQVKAKYADYRMPTLEEVLAVVPKDREIQAEIKTYGPGYAEKFVKAVAAAGLTAKNVTVSSFDHAALKDFKARHPEYVALWLVDLKRTPMTLERLIAAARTAKFDAVCPGCASTTGTLSPKDADAIRAAGLDFRVYGVNTPSQFRRAVQLGATGFTSDRYPESRAWAAAKMPRRGLCAHRGDRATCPENTPIAVRTAVEKGAEMVEFDLQRCKTGEIVVMHDATVDRTTDGKGRVAEMTFDELRRLDAGVKAGERFRGTKVPTLDEMLAVIPKEGVWINLHCYDDAGGRCLAEEVAEKLSREGRLHQGVIAASEAHLAAARAKWPDVITCDMSRPGGYRPGWPQERINAYIDTAVSSRCDSLQFFRSGTAADFERAGLNGLTVNYFDEDDPERCAKLFAAGVEFILTNDIDMNRRGLARHDRIAFADDARDAEPERRPPRKFVAAEQKSGTVAVYCDRPGREPQLQWAWSAKDDPNVGAEWRRLFGVPDECKPRDGGRTILVSDSLGGFAGLDVATGRCRFYGNAGGNPHSVELLPDGNVAVASSTGRTLKIFNVREHPHAPDLQKAVTALDLEGGHGVVWDGKRGTLFALGYYRLYELGYEPGTMSVKVLHCWDYTEACGDPAGHDLIPDGKGGYLFTNHSGVWRFDPVAETFANARTVENVKSISLSPDGDLMAIPRESWWTDTLLVFPSGSSDRSSAREIALPGAKFYKARWL